MPSVKYLCVLLVVFTSCHSVRQTTALATDVNHLTMAYAVSPKVPFNEIGITQPAPESEPDIIKETGDAIQITEIATGTVAKKTIKKAASFAQLKEMAASSEVKMSKKEVKILNRLESKYKGNFKEFRADSFEFTTKAKIIAGVGAVGLLLAIFAGSGFGAFLFILAALAFILRFLKIIEF